MTRALRILGVMTGTSCDGIDLACLEIQDPKWKVIWTASSSYPASLRRRVLALQQPRQKVRLQTLMELDRDLGLWFAKTIKAQIQRQRSARPVAIANHGQTVGHFPAPKALGSTLQLGDPTRIACETGLTVVSHFRSGDMSAGGQGAPLVPIFHKMIADSLNLSATGVSIHNLGGISNLTYIHRDEILAFDTGPGNIWIDAATLLATHGEQSFDRGGLLAAHGAIDISALREVLHHPYFSRKPPKSTGRDDFPFELLKRACRKKNIDLVATATAVTAWSVARAYRTFILDRQRPLRNIFLCGGGAQNHHLSSLIQQNLPEVSVRTLDEVSTLSGSYVEAAAFSYLGYLSLCGRPLGGTWTGAKSFGVPGLITPGENWQVVRKALE